MSVWCPLRRYKYTSVCVLQIWDRWSRPYIETIVKRIKTEHPEVPVTLYANGSGGLIERLARTGADVIGLDWTLDMADARARLQKEGNPAVQGNIDPVMLFADQDSIATAVHDCIAKAGSRGHILNLGHGVLVGTPEENVAFMFDIARQSMYKQAIAS